jgi:hypothetical protein
VQCKGWPRNVDKGSVFNRLSGVVNKRLWDKLVKVTRYNDMIFSKINQQDESHVRIGERTLTVP